MSGKQPSITEVFQRFDTEEECIAHFERLRWPEGSVCPKCEGKRVFKFASHGKTGKSRHLYEYVDCHEILGSRHLI